MVGLDVFAHVVNTMRENLTDDPWHKHFELPGWFNRLVDQGALGQKTKKGVYQKIGKEIRVLDLHTEEYRLTESDVDHEVKEILRERDWAKKLSGLRNSQHPQAKFLWATFRDVFHYCALQLENIANNARDLDFAVRWGFGWDNGPFEIWQAAGWQQVAGWIAADIAADKAMSEVPLPEWVTDPTRTGVHTAQGSWSPATVSYQPRSTLPVYRRQLFPDHLVGEHVRYGETIFETDDVRMWFTGDDIAILSFKSKMHAISNEVLDGILRAIDEAEAHFSALIIWQTEAPFSAGAHLLQLMQGVQESADQPSGLFDKLKGAANRVKYTVAGGGGLGQVLNAATGQRAARRGSDREVPACVAAPQVCAGADHRGGVRAGAGWRLRIPAPLHKNSGRAGKLHRTGRGRCRRIAGGRRLQGDGDARGARGTRRRHLPAPEALLPADRDGRSREERRARARHGLPQTVGPHRDEPA